MKKLDLEILNRCKILLKQDAWHLFLDRYNSILEASGWNIIPQKMNIITSSYGVADEIIFIVEIEEKVIYVALSEVDEIWDGDKLIYSSSDNESPCDSKAR